MRSCDTGQRIPCFDNISVVRKTDAQACGQVTTQIYISRMDKEPNFVSYEAKLAPPLAPVELRYKDIFKPQNKKMLIFYAYFIGEI